MPRGAPTREGRGLTSLPRRRAPRGRPELLAGDGAGRRAGCVALRLARSCRGGCAAGSGGAAGGWCRSSGLGAARTLLALVPL